MSQASHAKIHKPAELDDAYWASLTDRDRQLWHIVKPMPRAAYTVDQSLSTVERYLDSLSADLTSGGGRLELEPDFQRGHVWTDEQRSRYIESVLRLQASPKILFNCPGWVNPYEGGTIPEATMQCIDGLQRLTAIRKYVAGDITVFGGLTVHDLKGSPFDVKRSRMTFQVAVYEISERAELLDFYLRLNEGGTIHTEQELQRVRALRELAQSHATTEAPTPARKAPRP